jgi:hypothetical protein
MAPSEYLSTAGPRGISMSCVAIPKGLACCRSIIRSWALTTYFCNAATVDFAYRTPGMPPWPKEKEENYRSGQLT